MTDFVVFSSSGILFLTSKKCNGMFISALICMMLFIYIKVLILRILIYFGIFVQWIVTKNIITTETVDRKLLGKCSPKLLLAHYQIFYYLSYTFMFWEHVCVCMSFSSKYIHTKGNEKQKINCNTIYSTE